MSRDRRSSDAEIRARSVGARFRSSGSWSCALYGDEGFYTTVDGGSAGRRGDFITSPEVGPLFGAVIARYLDAEWERIGRPDEFTVVDAGAGPGHARPVDRWPRGPACADALRYVAVEISAMQRARHPDGVESVAAMPTGPIDGVVIANELLDNLPFRLAVFDRGLAGVVRHHATPTVVRRSAVRPVRSAAAARCRRPGRSALERR